MGGRTRRVGASYGPTLGRTEDSIGFDYPGPRAGCQFIEGEPGDPVCGRPTESGSSYCERHHARCYKPSGSGLSDKDDPGVR